MFMGNNHLRKEEKMKIGREGGESRIMLTCASLNSNLYKIPSGMRLGRRGRPAHFHKPSVTHTLFFLLLLILHGYVSLPPTTFNMYIHLRFVKPLS